MDFGSRLAYVRKEKGLNQEQLAEMLGITRQTVYKWEAGITYPDVDKLCDTAKKLGVTTSYLLGETELIEASEPKDEPGDASEPEPAIAPKGSVIKEFSSFAKLIGLATFIILVGVAQLVIMCGFENPMLDVLAVTFLLCCIFGAVLIYVFVGIRHENFLKSVTGELVFTDEELAKNAKSFTLKIVFGLAIIFVAIIALVISGFSDSEILPAIFTGVMFVCVGTGVYLFITGGVMNELYTAPKKSLMGNEERSKKSKLDDTVSGIIMLLAAAVFFIFGFLFDAWHPAWIAFPVGGILCGIASSVIKLIKGGSENDDGDEDEDED